LAWACSAAGKSWSFSGGFRLIATLLALPHCFLHCLFNSGPFPRRWLAASSVLRARPTPTSARTFHRWRPVGGPRHRQNGSPVLRLFSLLACRRQSPGGPAPSIVRVPVQALGFDGRSDGLPLTAAGSASTMVVSGPARRSPVPVWASLRPAGSLSRPQTTRFHRKLQPIRYLLGCSDCYRAEQSTSRAGLTPAGEQRLFTAHG
jgi:hypothetical protein